MLYQLQIIQDDINKMPQTIILDIISNLIWALLGSVALYLYRFFFRILPKKLLWSLADPKSLIICISASTKTNTGKYLRPSTGTGQVRALAAINPSLHSAYSDIQVKNIILSDEPVGERIENDIILLGGPKTNEVTGMFIEKVKSLGIDIEQDERELRWNIKKEQEKFVAVVASEKVELDYGLIVRMKNPFSSRGTTFCLFSGGHTYGGIAAAQYFVTHYRKFRRIGKIIKPTLIAVVSCDVIDGYPVNVRLVKEYSSWRNFYENR